MIKMISSQYYRYTTTEKTRSKITKQFIPWILILSALFGSVVFANPPPANEVFQPTLTLIDPNTFSITWKIKPGYFLYADRISIGAAKNIGAEIGNLRFPTATTKTDRLGRVYPIYRNELILPISVLGQKKGNPFISIAFQGCSDDGFCYPPISDCIQLTINDDLALTEVELIKPSPLEASKVVTQPQDNIAAIFSDHYWPAVLLIFLGLGLLLSFTPCVLPMVPVLSGIIVGHGNISTKKAFALSLSYVLSMAFTYALIGIVVAQLGKNLQIIMQMPWIIALFSALFVLLALSMFGLFELKLPVAWQAKLAATNRRQSSGHYISAAIMGCLSTLVLSPCVTAPLVGALGYIAQSNNLLLGGSALFAMGLGMGLPLLLIGTSAGKWLPKAGPWMNVVKSFFGFLLLAVAIYLLSRIAPPQLIMLAWAMLFIFSGVYSGALITGHSHREKLAQSMGITLFAYGLILLLATSMGNTNPLKPLDGLTTKDQLNSMPASVSTSERTVTDITQLKTVLADHKGKPIMLDFYADWCASCKVMEATTFKNRKFKQAIAKFVVIRVDVTRNGPEQQALLNKYHVVAPPTFIFLNKQGQEQTNARIIGDISTQDFIKQLEAVSK